MSEEETAWLQPANDNPWYCLATVYGEQEKGLDGLLSSNFDESLATRNRHAWNRWMTTALSPEQREELGKKGFDKSELVPLQEEERARLIKDFVKRTKATLPDPKEVANFQEVRFEREVSFSGFAFPTKAFFDGAAFGHFADFRDAAFFDNTYFGKVRFSNSADFRKAMFSGAAFFSEAKFVGPVDFQGASFCDELLFLRAICSSDADFRNATFSGAARFHKAEFSGNADFRDAAFGGTAYFREVAFSRIADFWACEFKSHTSFVGAEFQSRVPDFRDAKLREVTEWHDAQWPPSPQNKQAAQDQVYAYERLKAEMERLKKHADEQFFFAKELRARRQLERRYSPLWLLNWAYEVFSGYGQSIGFPSFWLVALFALGTDIFALVPVRGDAPLPYDVAEGLSLTNLLPLVPYKVDKGIIDCLSATAKIVGNLQSFLGVILLFLLGLALRNRFRMK